MKLRHTFYALALTASLLSAAEGFSRGGETGTLDEAEGLFITPRDTGRMPSHRWSPFYLSWDHFRRLRARLNMQPLAPIPSWDSKRAWRHHDRYFTEDGDYEIFPVVTEPVR